MNRKCIVKNCSNNIAFLCSCLKDNEYYCKAHGMKHIISGGEHTLKALRIKLNNQENDKIVKKAKEIIESLQRQK